MNEDGGLLSWLPGTIVKCVPIELKHLVGCTFHVTLQPFRKRFMDLFQQIIQPQIRHVIVFGQELLLFCFHFFIMAPLPFSKATWLAVHMQTIKLLVDIISEKQKFLDFFTNNNLEYKLVLRRESFLKDNMQSTKAEISPLWCLSSYLLHHHHHHLLHQPLTLVKGNKFNFAMSEFRIKFWPVISRRTGYFWISLQTDEETSFPLLTYQDKERNDSISCLLSKPYLSSTYLKPLSFPTDLTSSSGKYPFLLINQHHYYKIKIFNKKNLKLLYTWYISQSRMSWVQGTLVLYVKQQQASLSVHRRQQ